MNTSIEGNIRQGRRVLIRELASLCCVQRWHCVRVLTALMNIYDALQKNSPETYLLLSL